MQNSWSAEQVTTTLPTLRLTLSWLPQASRGAFETAQFIVKDGRAWGLATCNCFLLGWDLSK